MQTAAEKINNYNAASTDLDNMIPEAFNVSENSCATMQRAMTSDLVKNMTERTITAV
jgi:hypothetical protein